MRDEDAILFDLNRKIEEATGHRFPWEITELVGELIDAKLRQALSPAPSGPEPRPLALSRLVEPIGVDADRDELKVHFSLSFDGDVKDAVHGYDHHRVEDGFEYYIIDSDGCSPKDGSLSWVHMTVRSTTPEAREVLAGHARGLIDNVTAPRPAGS